MLASDKTAHLYIFTQQFASMMASGLRLVSVLSNLAREMPSRRLRNVVEDITEDVYSGINLADAMEKHPKVFNNIYVNMVRSGLNAGKLSEALEQLSEYLEKADNVKKKIQTACLYPAFIFIAFVIVFHVMSFIILPRFQVLFETMGRKLPDMTLLVMNIGVFYADNWPFLLGGLIFIIALSFVWVTSTDGRLIWDEMKLRLPLVGTVWRAAAVSRFLRTFAVQLRNHIPAVQALRLAADATANAYLAEIVWQVAERVESGETLAASFGREEIFEGIVVQMVASGEEAGTMDRLLLSAANYFDTLLFQRINSLTAMVNPLLTAIDGAGIAGMLVASFLPVFEMSGGAY